jgi:hypothetical protein
VVADRYVKMKILIWNVCASGAPSTKNELLNDSSVVIPHAIKLKILFLIGFDLNMGIRDGVCLRNKSSLLKHFVISSLLSDVPAANVTCDSIERPNRADYVIVYKAFLFLNKILVHSNISWVGESPMRPHHY